MNIDEVIKLLEKNQEEYFKRLEKIMRMQTIKSIVRTVCLCIIVVVYLFLYFHTPYLTKNYVENREGNVYQDVQNVNGNVGGED